MLSKWTQHLSDPDEIARFEKDILSSREVLQRLDQIMSERDRDLDTAKSDYEQAAWPYKAADTVGRRAEIRNVRKLLDIDRKIIEL